jgi:hypothetical protein
MTEEKKIKIEFAPGAFDQFDGTQEELDELMNEIRRMVESGEFLEQSRRVDFDELIEEDPELAEKLAESFSDKPTRNLQ